jgi:hypothetical protein
MMHGSRGRSRPVVLDVDETGHLPPSVYVPCQPGDGAGPELLVELQEMRDGRHALLVFSSAERLLASYGEQQKWVALAAHDLPAIQQHVGFHAVLLDVALPRPRESPTESRAQPPTVDTVDIDASSGEPLVYVPSRPFSPGDKEAQIELQPLASGLLALPAYSTAAKLAAGCGPHQHYVCFRAGLIDEICQQVGADQVVIDTPLPEHLRHRAPEGWSLG